MGKLTCIGLSILMILSVGCSKEEYMATEHEIRESIVLEESKQLTANDFKLFFENYFAFTEDDLLELNKNYQSVDSEYWGHFKNYQQKLLTQIGDYLNEEVKVILQSNYLNDTIQLPRKLKINEYVTYASGRVEDLELTSMYLMGEDYIYEITVTVLHKIQQEKVFDSQYKWCEQLGYYVLRENGLKDKSLASKLEDEIKLQQKYWIQVPTGKVLKIKSIQEAAPLILEGKERLKIANSQYAKPIPYEVKVTKEQRIAILRLLENIMLTPKASWNYYEKTIQTGYEGVKSFWKDRGVLEVLNIQEGTYDKNFKVAINPYKDNVEKITLDINETEVIPSIYSTKVKPRFMVTIPIKALLSNNEIVYYKYKYFIGMEENKVEFIEFMNMELLTDKAQ